MLRWGFVEWNFGAAGWIPKGSGKGPEHKGGGGSMRERAMRQAESNLSSFTLYYNYILRCVRCEVISNFTHRDKKK
jgi:hypothetical protein